MKPGCAAVLTTLLAGFSFLFIVIPTSGTASRRVCVTFPNLFSSLTQPYRYVGQQYYYSEGDIGFQLLGQRWYDAEIGRFVSRDPIGYIGGINLYSYTKNNPGNFTDAGGSQVGPDPPPPPSNEFTCQRSHAEPPRCPDWLHRIAVHWWCSGCKADCYTYCRGHTQGMVQENCYAACDRELIRCQAGNEFNFHTIW